MNVSDKSASAVPECLGAMLFLLFAMLLFLHESAPVLADYMNWTYSGIILRDHWRSFPETAHMVKHYPVPNSAATLGVALFALLFSWQIASKLWLCTQFAISFNALHHFARTLKVNGWMWAVVPGAVFFSLDLWWGFVNFELGVAWTLLFASMLVQRAQKPDDTSAFEPVLLLTLTMVFFAHMIPCAFCCLLLVCFAWQTRRWKALWNAAPPVILTSWYTFARYLVHANVDGSTGQISSEPFFSIGFWLFKINSYLKSLGFVNPIGIGYETFGNIIFPALFLCNLLLATLVAWLMFQGARSAFHTLRPERFLWSASILMLPVFLLLPGAMLGIGDPGARLLQTFLAVCLVLLFTQKSRLFPLVGICSLALTGASAGLFARFVTSPKILAMPSLRVLPKAVTHFANAPYTNQIYFYDALQHGDTTYFAFPSGMLLNKPSAKNDPAALSSER